MPARSSAAPTARGRPQSASVPPTPRNAAQGRPQGDRGTSASVPPPQPPATGDRGYATSAASGAAVASTSHVPPPPPSGRPWEPPSAKSRAGMDPRQRAGFDHPRGKLARQVLARLLIPPVNKMVPAPLLAVPLNPLLRHLLPPTYRPSVEQGACNAPGSPLEPFLWGFDTPRG